jgi:hypothetical protein
VEHVASRLNLRLTHYKALHTYRIVCRSVSEFFGWFRVLCWSKQIHSKFSPFIFVYNPPRNPSLDLSPFPFLNSFTAPLLSSQFPFSSSVERISNTSWTRFKVPVKFHLSNLPSRPSQVPFKSL